MTILREPPFTHYSYLVCPNSHQEPTGLYNLSQSTREEAKELKDFLFHGSGSNAADGGELFSAVPLDTTVPDMETLRSLLKWLHTNPNRRRPPEETDDN